MVRVSMIATDVIDRPGLSAAPGDRLAVTPIQAAMLTYRRLARFSTAADDLPPPPAPEPEPPQTPTRKRRTYRRRDMVAEK